MSENPTLKDMTSALNRLIYLHDTELDDSVRESIIGEIEALEPRREAKIEAICQVYKNIEDLANSIEARAKDRLKRAKSLHNQAEHLKNYLASFLQPREQFESDDHRLMWRKSKSCIIDNEEEVPSEFRIPQPDKINKRGISNYLDQVGALSYAHFEENLNLSIK